MPVPQWLSLVISSAVILFAIYRLWLAFAGPSDEERKTHRRGMLAMPRRQHGAIGFIFLIVAGALVATAFGWKPLTSSSTKTEAPAKPEPPKQPGIVVE